ncbi:peptide chain release factor N(5)-glutamine methyltransferase [Pseudoxanthomonas dokdonensis]|uniref:Release factor glutamine methyltransferase n=1 Tax=Pseudoxanthomonas dokdonensis TaxID=344882 RepID=A0A0R0CPF4_9GAMM|nr:peptide chain release factor N(5)-glutamine methyltransferase [Pseudoxanthomonas dokdonensis]KRG67348.1 SAM-dependent methyltransferase [Pseudoxanthomonas dokdonensis]
MSTPPSDVSQWLLDATAQLPAEDGRQVAELLLGHALQRDRAWLFAHARDPVPASAASALQDLLRRRLAGEPVAYLLGRRGFWTLDLEVSPDTLIPRPETELLVEQVLQRVAADSDGRLLDLGTGSGAIALAVASERPRMQVWASDASAGALAVARRNAASHGLERVQFRHGSWWQPFAGMRFDVIASNPPYIAAADPHLQRGDLRHEPASALSSGADGLDAIRAIVAGAPHHLNPHGWLLLEHGWDQGEAIRALLRDAGLQAVQTVQDLEARDRVSLGQWLA